MHKVTTSGVAVAMDFMSASDAQGRLACCASTQESYFIHVQEECFPLTSVHRTGTGAA